VSGSTLTPREKRVSWSEIKEISFPVC